MKHTHPTPKVSRNSVNSLLMQKRSCAETFVVFGHVGETLAQEFHAFQAFTPQFCWGKTHTLAYTVTKICESQEITANHIPEVPGHLDPPAGKKEKKKGKLF